MANTRRDAVSAEHFLRILIRRQQPRGVVKSERGALMWPHRPADKDSCPHALSRVQKDSAYPVPRIISTQGSEGVQLPPAITYQVSFSSNCPGFQNMEKSRIVQESKEGDVHVEDTFGSDNAAALETTVHVDGEIWNGINRKTVLAFLVRSSFSHADDSY